MISDHKHSHPVQPPLGTLRHPGPCTVCGKSWARVQAEKQLREAQDALAMLDAKAQP